MTGEDVSGVLDQKSIAGIEQQPGAQVEPLL